MTRVRFANTFKINFNKKEESEALTMSPGLDRWREWHQMDLCWQAAFYW